ncbi:hypothetical protein WN48_09109 [Eufriesea mexicana]|uniref:Uncharacterized protein n=1 Tax=Eufriesea mexicana TaxID=516756 RepID=A0A310SFJ3_9HYME|nr:hypothetical protein WN48_09109 [Eufriesea mexicana]
MISCELARTLKGRQNRRISCGGDNICGSRERFAVDSGSSLQLPTHLPAAPAGPPALQHCTGSMSVQRTHNQPLEPGPQGCLTGQGHLGECRPLRGHGPLDRHRSSGGTRSTDDVRHFDRFGPLRRPESLSEYKSFGLNRIFWRIKVHETGPIISKIFLDKIHRFKVFGVKNHGLRVSHDEVVRSQDLSRSTTLHHVADHTVNTCWRSLAARNHAYVTSKGSVKATNKGDENQNKFAVHSKKGKGQLTKRSAVVPPGKSRARCSKKKAGC